MPPRKTILITGASSGMGYYSAQQLGLQGFNVIAGVRNTSENRQKIDWLNEKVKSANRKNSVSFLGLELSDLDSVKDTAERVQKQYPSIDVLMCNAGVMNPPYTFTDDNYELQFQINFLSQLYFTLLIKKSILAADQPRIINICSLSAEKGSINNLDDLYKISKVNKKNYKAITCYRESKLAQMVSTYALSKQPDWDKIHFSLVHPGIVNTPLFYKHHNAWLERLASPFVWLGYATGKLKTVAKGADTALWLATKETPEQGYWYNRKNRQPNPIVNNFSYAQQLLETYANLLGVAI